MADSIYKWSLTAASNDQSDSIINWRENQLPDTVNDSARAMMQRVAEWREDMTGGLVTTGTQPAYSVASRAQFDTLDNGRFITVRVHATNAAGAATLNVNGLGAKAIRKFGLTGDLPLVPGDLQLGGLYTFLYSTTANAGAGAWVTSGGVSSAVSAAFPAGTAMLFLTAAAPVGWTKQTTHDNKALRVVSGTGGASGGTTAFTSVFASRTPTGNNTASALTVAMLPVHSHGVNIWSAYQDADHAHILNANTSDRSADHIHGFPAGGWVVAKNNSGGSPGSVDGGTAVTNVTGGASAGHYHTTNAWTGGVGTNHRHAVNGTSDNTGSGATHNHAWTGDAMDFAVQYVDSIICTKD